MSSKIKISEVLHLAADKYLAKNLDEYWNSSKHCFSCCAVESAINEFTTCFYQCQQLLGIIEQGFASLGLDIFSSDTFEEFEKCGNITEESQGARYSWLKFCAMLAEEQGE